MPHVHVLTSKTQADPERLARVVAIVVDVIFATTGIAIALDRGAADIVPASDPDAARCHAQRLAPGSFLLVGEQEGELIEGFAEPWPTALLQADLAGKRIVYSTTNGTVALNRVACADLVLAAAPVNAGAVAKHVVEHHRGRNIVLLCAGSGSAFSLEDFYGAGCIASLLAAAGTAFELSDAANAARLLYENVASADCIDATYAGRMMLGQGRGADLRLCRRQSILDVVPVCVDGRITRA